MMLMPAFSAVLLTKVRRPKMAFQLTASVCFAAWSSHQYEKT